MPHGVPHGVTLRSYQDEDDGFSFVIDTTGSSCVIKGRTSGDGNSYTVELTFDQDGILPVKIVGEWEWQEFREALELIVRLESIHGMGRSPVS